MNDEGEQSVARLIQVLTITALILFALAFACSLAGAISPSTCRVMEIEEGTPAGLGSGVLVAISGERGYVLTAQHVVEGAKRVLVVFPESKYAAFAQAYATQKEDIALLVIPANERLVPRPAAWREVAAGERLFCSGWGNTKEKPRDQWCRALPTETKTAAGTKRFDDPTLLVSGSARMGDSGGPVCDADGYVVGILWGTAGGQTYAVPLHSQPWIRGLMEETQIRRRKPWMHCN